jgi:hypothetical protein
MQETWDDRGDWRAIGTASMLTLVEMRQACGHEADHKGNQHHPGAGEDSQEGKVARGDCEGRHLGEDLDRHPSDE